ncbi:hypothetical protein [Streptomyces sp. NPDC020965]|uniref:hypothetical protein n=1 Tax=Streptomyces sp. NPDC020965 TaxID=3365105 RepID=UPI0037B176A5
MIAEGAVYGTGERVAVVLGTCRTISPKLALRWLRGQALRIADGLDPGWARPIAETERAAGPDGPTRLRSWCHDAGDRRAARLALKDGVPVSLVVSDGVNGTYALAIRPVVVRSGADPEIPAGLPPLVRS